MAIVVVSISVAEFYMIALARQSHRKQLTARFVAWREFTELAQNPCHAF
jgi:hypothetical protein